MKLTVGDVRRICLMACLGFWIAVGVVIWCASLFFGG